MFCLEDNSENSPEIKWIEDLRTNVKEYVYAKALKKKYWWIETKNQVLFKRNEPKTTHSSKNINYRTRKYGSLKVNSKLLLLIFLKNMWITAFYSILFLFKKIKKR